MWDDLLLAYLGNVILTFNTEMCSTDQIALATVGSPEQRHRVWQIIIYVRIGLFYHR